ncbi:MAG: hypothetical protein H6562_24370 [Lewinellaceae bacterium]|nr:hypothetical protein [Lewinella sp.]MCB9282047.1 hypothetical protein [Lewinellaceae bacterium]
MEKAPQKAAFSAFLDRFPQVELPVTLGEDTHHTFSRNNKPLPAQLIEQYILPAEEEEADDLTEFVACFRLETLPAYSALVYWRAGLYSYQYILMTFDKKGDLIDRRVIAGSYYDEANLTQSVATLTEDRKIFVVSGQSDPAGDHFDPATSTTHQFQLGEDGRIGEAV